MGSRAPRKRRRCWRGEAKDKGFARRPTPTWAAARQGKSAGVGVAWRKTKAFREGQRQHGRPPAQKIRALLAWRDEGQRLCGVADANMGARAPRKRRRCWRGVAKDKGFAGRPTPTWATAGAENSGPVGVARRRRKALRGARRQHGRPPTQKIRALLAWRKTKAFRGGRRQHGQPRAEEKATVLAWRGERHRLSG